MRIAVFASDVPYPPNRGGRADVWRRILAFRRLGHEVMLVHLHEPSGPAAPTNDHLSVIDEAVAARFSFPIKRGVWRTARQLAMAWRTPWHAATRVPTTVERVQLEKLVNTFSPDLLWLEGPWFGPVVRELARSRRCPFVYRSHNVEHRYLWRQASVAVRLRDQVAWRLACIGVARFERLLMGEAVAVFDISMDDLEYWRALGVERLHWLPPLPELAVEAAPGDLVPGDVVFIGNLQTPNNVRGVEFLLKLVLPRVRARHPAVRFSIVGSNPTSHVRECVANAQGVDLQVNVDEPMRFLFGARVLVNPVMTGSGVQLKMLDMLMADAPIVTSPQGTRGLPRAIADLLLVAETPDDFADAVCIALEGATPGHLAARQRSRAQFSVDAVANALQAVQEGGSHAS